MFTYGNVRYLGMALAPAKSMDLPSVKIAWVYSESLKTWIKVFLA